MYKFGIGIDYPESVEKHNGLSKHLYCEYLYYKLEPKIYVIEKGLFYYFATDEKEAGIFIGNNNTITCTLKYKPEKYYRFYKTDTEYNIEIEKAKYIYVSKFLHYVMTFLYPKNTQINLKMIL